MYEYNAHVIRVVDGDTLHVLVDLGLDIQQSITLRLAGVNTPEMSTPEGHMAKQFTEDWLIAQGPIVVGDDPWAPVPVKVRTIKDKKEKFGRYLAVVWPHDYTTRDTDTVPTIGSLNSNLITQGWTYGRKT